MAEENARRRRRADKRQGTHARHRLWPSALVLAVTATLVAAGCGGPGSSEPSRAGPVSRALAHVPDSEGARERVLVADLDRLRGAYPGAGGIAPVLADVWLPDALAGADRPLWKQAFGLDLTHVSLVAAAGFHPASLMVAEGRFAPERIGRALEERGYADEGDSWSRGLDGSVDVSSEVGRLTLSSADRLAAGRDLLVAASTTSLLLDAQAPAATLADDPTYADAARALDPITSAALVRPQLVRPPAGVPVTQLTNAVPELVGVGIDDLGPEGRTLKIVLVYGSEADATADGERIAERIATATAPNGGPLAEIDGGWDVSVDKTVVRLAGVEPAGSQPGQWRGLFESGDLALIVKSGP
jgi:hypothetical protein